MSMFTVNLPKTIIVEDQWRDNHINLACKNHDGYSDYPQTVEPFVPEVGIIDLLFLVGDAAPDYI